MDSITKHKPQVSIEQTFDFDENAPKEELVFDLWRKLIVARNIQDATFIAIGKMLKCIRDKKLYKFLDFENFSQFLSSEELSFSREKAYLYIRTYELYVEHLNLSSDELSKMGVAKLMMLAPLVKETHSKEDAIQKINEMKDMRYGDFVREVKSQIDKSGKPSVYWSKEADKWIVNYYENTTHLVSLGDYEGRTENS